MHIMMFCWLGKAFDSINRVALWCKIGKTGFCEEVAEFIKIKYDKNKLLRKSTSSYEEMTEAAEQKTVMNIKFVALFLILLVQWHMEL
jgi:hypothetical protein